MRITTHVLDLSSGRPVSDLSVALRVQQSDGTWRQLASVATDTEGRVRQWPMKTPRKGRFRLVFDTATYFAERSVLTLYPEVVVTFEGSADVSYHLPLLLSPFGYTTYRGT